MTNDRKMGELIPFPTQISSPPPHAEDKSSDLLIFRGVVENDAIKILDDSQDMNTVRKRLLELDGKHTCTRFLCEEEPENTVDIKEVFNRAFDRLKKEMSETGRHQVRIEVVFIHPSTRTFEFQNKVKTFFDYSDAAVRVKSELAHGSIHASGHRINDQSYAGFTVENYYYF